MSQQSLQPMGSNIRVSSVQQLEQDHLLNELQKIQKRIEQQINLERKQISPGESSAIMESLRNHFIFYNLSQAELQNVTKKMLYAKVQKDKNIYQKNTVGSCFFIVKTGILQIKKDNKNKKVIKPNDGFGQVALLYNTERNQIVTTKERTQLWVIDRTTFRQAVQQVIVMEYMQNRRSLEGIRFFVNLTNEQKDLIASALIVQKFYKDQTIVQEGDPGSSLYYIKEGFASVYKTNKFIKKLMKGDSFGEQSLYYNTMRQLTVKADEQVTCLVLGRDTLNRVLGDKVYDITFKNFIRWAFQKNPIMNKLSRQHMDKIIEFMKISSFKVNQTILRKGVTGFQKLVVVIEGGLRKLKTGTIVAGKCQCYGQQFLTIQNRSKTLDDQIIMQTNGVIAQISDSAFYEALDKTYIQIIRQIQFKRKQKLEQHKNQIADQLQYRNMQKKQDLHIKDLISIIKVQCNLAKGQFGHLYLVNYDSQNYVVKVMSKYQLQQAEVCEFILDQSKVMAFVSFPFIVKCGRRYQTPFHLTYITEYVQGQEFYEVLKKLGLLSTSDSKFYAGIIILILQYFQNVQIICRDIKPENFLVQANGYLKLINLSTSKISKVDSSNKIAKTFTVIGTPHYMAPDIVFGKGYTNMVDLWSLGICLYQFMCGTLPFGDSSQSAYEIYEQILKKDLKFPEFIKDKKAKKLIQQLLNHTPQHRHGGSFAALKSHPWFQGFNWDEIIRKNSSKVSVPLIPQIKDILKRRDQFTDKKLDKLLQELDKNAHDQLAKKPHDIFKKSITFDWKDFDQKIQDR